MRANGATRAGGWAAMLLAVGSVARAAPRDEDVRPASAETPAGGVVVCEEPRPLLHRLLGKPAAVTVYPPAAPAPANPPSPAGATPAPAGPPAPFTPPVSAEAGTTVGVPPSLLADATGAASSGLGGVLSAGSSPVLMQGDLSPIGRIVRQQLATDPFLPPPPPERPGGRTNFLPRSAAIVPSVRTFKFADNQTPFPVDRVFATFNFYDYVNQSLNKRFDVPLNRIQAYRYTLGFEKTFFNKNASVGVRMPIDTLSAQSRTPGFGGTSTSVGDLSVFFKYALWQDREAGRVLSTGLAVTAPTGPGSFAGADYLRRINHYAFLQPYVGFQWQWDRFYVMNYLAVEVPTGPRDVTILFNDTAVGYFVYRSASADALIRAVAPTLEAHVNVPLNHRDWANPASVAGTPDVVDLTSGLNVFLGKRAILSLGAMTPVTGPRPASLEALAYLNVFF